jgi:hypothetical protein
VKVSHIKKMVGGETAILLVQNPGGKR